jgi:Ca2+-binding EF-hand superfamily protein
LKCKGTHLSDNDILKIDLICKKLIKLFDINKNGKLEFTELVSAFCILCKGSIEQKLKYLMHAYLDKDN